MQIIQMVFLGLVTIGDCLAIATAVSLYSNGRKAHNSRDDLETTKKLKINNRLRIA